MIYLKLFQNNTEYNAYTADTANFIKPNVSLTVDNNTVHYNPYVDPYAGHEYVDLGLPSGTKWATMNIGASQPSDYGLYFAWGDTQGYTASQVGSGEGQKYFGWADYKYSNNGGSSASDMTKYNSSDGLVTLQASDDAVVTNWGGSWKMPTETQFNELLNNSYCTNVWTGITVGGTTVYGRLFTSKSNGNTLFFPAAGLCNDGSVNDVGGHGYYWSSSLYTSNVSRGWRLLFFSGDVVTNYGTRRGGYPVRGVVG